MPAEISQLSPIGFLVHVYGLMQNGCHCNLHGFPLDPMWILLSVIHMHLWRPCWRMESLSVTSDVAMTNFNVWINFWFIRFGVPCDSLVVFIIFSCPRHPCQRSYLHEDGRTLPWHAVALRISTYCILKSSRVKSSRVNSIQVKSRAFNGNARTDQRVSFRHI